MYLEPQRQRQVDSEVIELLRQKYGLDQPIHIQYGRWLGNVVRGDFGESFRHRRPVSDLLVEAIIDAKVDQIHISIDGATASTFEDIRTGARFEVLMRNLQTLGDRKRERGTKKPLLQFNVTLMRRNIEDLPAFVDLAESLDVERIAARHMMPYAGLGMESDALSNHKQLWHSPKPRPRTTRNQPSRIRL